MLERISKKNYKRIWDESEASSRFDLITEYKNTRTPVIVQCKNCGKRKETKFYELVRRGVKCECENRSNEKHTSIEKVLNRVYEEYGNNCIEYVSGYENYESVPTFKCNTCGYNFEKSLHGFYQDFKHKRDHPCSMCKGLNYKEMDKLTLKDIKINKYTFEYLWYHRLHLDKLFRILSIDIDNLSKLKVRCLTCGEVIDIRSYEYLIRGSRHGHKLHKFNKEKPKDNISDKKILTKKKTLSTDYFQKRLDSNTEKGRYTVLDPGEGWSKKSLIRCNICQYEWNVSCSGLVHDYERTGKFRCPSCNGMVRRFGNYDYLITWLKTNRADLQIHLTEEEYMSFKNKRMTHIDFSCMECGNHWKATLNNILRGTKCPKCSNHQARSKLEDQMKDFLVKNGINENDIVMRSRRILGNGKELDIYLPEQKVAIEINGLYWHSEKYKGKNYHLDKKNAAQDKGINLLQFYDDDYSDKVKRKIIEDKVLNTLHLNKNRIYARDCEIRFNVNSDDKSEFLNSNHIQGNDSSSSNIALYHAEEIVSIMTFSKPRAIFGFNSKNKENKIELVRFATKIGTNVVGGFSRLLKHYIDECLNDGDIIVTYANKDVSNGDLYRKNGFKYTHSSKPSYFYVHRNSYKRFSRFKFRKDRLKNIYPNIYSDDKTEFEIMDEAHEYYRVWNSGNYVFELEVKK